MQRSMFWPSRIGLFCAVAAVTYGCPSSGLDAYNKGDEEAPPPEDDGGEEEPPPLELDECATACDMARAEASWLGCDIECDVGIAADYEADASVTVIVGLGGLVHVEGEGEVDGGGSCDFVIACPEPTPCESLYLRCTSDQVDPAVWSACYEEYQTCVHDEACTGQLIECEGSADLILEACLDVAVTTEEIADCEEVNADARQTCQCLYDSCLAYNGGEECDDDQGGAIPVPPPPVQTGPGRWRVSRRLISHELARLASLDSEIAVFPVVEPKDLEWKGLRVMSIRPSDTIYALGIRDGDVLISTNGRPLAEAGLHPASLLSLRSEPEVRLTLDRGGMTRRFTYVLVE